MVAQAQATTVSVSESWIGEGCMMVTPPSRLRLRCRPLRICCWWRLGCCRLGSDCRCCLSRWHPSVRSESPHRQESTGIWHAKLRQATPSTRHLRQRGFGSALVGAGGGSVGGVDEPV